jgi:hypothetical protein
LQGSNHVALFQLEIINNFESRGLKQYIRATALIYCLTHAKSLFEKIRAINIVEWKDIIESFKANQAN